MRIVPRDDEEECFDRPHRIVVQLIEALSSIETIASAIKMSSGCCALIKEEAAWQMSIFLYCDGARSIGAMHSLPYTRSYVARLSFFNAYIS